LLVLGEQKALNGDAPCSARLIRSFFYDGSTDTMLRQEVHEVINTISVSFYADLNPALWAK
jgi:hypothetical protein